MATKKVKMFLWVWEDVLTDYSSGIMFAIAPTAEKARELIIVKENTSYSTPPEKTKLELAKYRQYRKAMANCSEYDESIGCIWKDLDKEPNRYSFSKSVAFVIWGGG